jgi:hypothetical protein
MALCLPLGVAACRQAPADPAPAAAAKPLPPAAPPAAATTPASPAAPAPAPPKTADGKPPDTQRVSITSRTIRFFAGEQPDLTIPGGPYRTTFDQFSTTEIGYEVVMTLSRPAPYTNSFHFQCSWRDGKGEFEGLGAHVAVVREGESEMRFRNHLGDPKTEWKVGPHSVTCADPADRNAVRGEFTVLETPLAKRVGPIRIWEAPALDGGTPIFQVTRILAQSARFIRFHFEIQRRAAAFVLVSPSCSYRHVQAGRVLPVTTRINVDPDQPFVLAGGAGSVVPGTWMSGRYVLECRERSGVFATSEFDIW